jgi:hypothetical protein
MDKVQEMLSDPESMKQIQELANMFTSELGNSAEPTPNNTPHEDVPPTDTTSDGGLDFGTILQLMQLFNDQSSSQDERLLLAIKPYLTTARQTKVDKAIKLMKAYEVFTTAKDSGLLNNLENLV